MKFVTHHSSTRPKLRWLERRGDGPPIVFLHGVCRCAEDFDPLWPHVPPDRRVIAVDQRGHGGSKPAARYLVTDYIADAVALLRELAEPVIIYGHSLGAMVAAGVAAELPEMVRATVLEDPPFHAMGRNIAGTSWQLQFTAMREIALRGSQVMHMANALAEICLPQRDGSLKRLGDLRDEASLLWSAMCLYQLDPEVLTPLIEGRWLDGYDTAETFRRIRCPVLLLQADSTAGGALTDADAQLASTTIASCEVVRFPGSGHLLHWLEPERIGRLIDSFVRTIRQ